MTSSLDQAADPQDELRFGFGKNWLSFLDTLDDRRVDEATKSLAALLGVEDLGGRRFLDVGCGSGLFSLAAMRLGASRVHSFDYDRDSVECARMLRRRFFPDDDRWSFERGSALDAAYLGTLGVWDVVYSWGVLHHTGDMWTALDRVAPLVRPGGMLSVAIYNDQGPTSRFWTAVKRAYNRNAAGRALVRGAFIPYFALRGVAGDLLHARDPRRRYVEYRRSRGMSLVHDWIDWIGGYPFEVASVDAIVRFYVERGFSPVNVITRAPGHGCNEFVFTAAGA